MRPGQLVMMVPLTVGLSLAACQKPAPPPPPPTAHRPVTPKPPSPTPTAVSGKSDPGCIAPFTTKGKEAEFKLGKWEFKQAGAELSITNPDSDHHVVLGVIANFFGATPDNVVNMKKYIKFFEQQHAEAILVDGDSGDNAADIAASLELVAQADLPTFVIPGNRESAADYKEAIANVMKRHSTVIDMTQIRLVNFDDVSIVSLPGYYDKRYLNAGAGGCQYFKEDVDALADIIKAATSPVLLLSHAEPHGSGRQAIDAFADGNAGDAYLEAFLRAHPVHFAVVGNIEEAGGTATDIDSRRITPGEMDSRVFLNAGKADSVRWAMNDGSISYGMVDVMTIDDDKASYKVFRAPDLHSSEQKGAQPASATIKKETPKKR